jgi:glycerol-3-phosphate acyltransferase PlsY
MPIDILLKIVLVFVISYVLGAVPVAYLIARTKGVNIFEIGSGNMGATNVSRAIGFGWGIVVWLLDTSKGIIAILIAQQILSEHFATATVIAAVMAIVGHNWSIFTMRITGQIRGGKGASIAFGTLLVIAPHVLVVVGLIGGLIALITRYMSLAVLVMFSISTLWLLVLVSQNMMAPEYVFYALLVAALIAFRFRENIRALLSGTERRLGDRV